MQTIEVRGRNLREALERASREVGDAALVLSRRAERDGSIVLALRPSLLDLPAPNGAARVARPGTGDVERFLRASGLTPATIDRVCEAVAGRLHEGAHPLDIAADEIGMMFQIARVARDPGVTRVIAALGATGVGKTTSLVKLAARARRAGRRVAVACLESGRVDTLEIWKGHASVLGIPFLPVRRAADLKRAETELAAAELVLLDTSGRIEQEVALLAECKELVLSRSDRMVWSAALVIAATSSPGALDATSRCCAPLAPSLSILTKLDETRSPAPALEHVLHENMPVAFLSDGPEIATDFHRPTGELFADLLLWGRIRR